MTSDIKVLKKSKSTQTQVQSLTHIKVEVYSFPSNPTVLLLCHRSFGLLFIILTGPFHSLSSVRSFPDCPVEGLVCVYFCLQCSRSWPVSANTDLKSTIFVVWSPETGKVKPRTVSVKGKHLRQFVSKKSRHVRVYILITVVNLRLLAWIVYFIAEFLLYILLDRLLLYSSKLYTIN